MPFIQRRRLSVSTLFSAQLGAWLEYDDEVV